MDVEFGFIQKITRGKIVETVKIWEDLYKKSNNKSKTIDTAYHGRLSYHLLVKIKFSCFVN